MAYQYTDRERDIVMRHRSQLFVGTPADVKARLDQLARETQADEIMITSPIYDHEARKASTRADGRSL